MTDQEEQNIVQVPGRIIDQMHERIDEVVRDTNSSFKQALTAVQGINKRLNDLDDLSKKTGEALLELNTRLASLERGVHSPRLRVPSKEEIIQRMEISGQDWTTCQEELIEEMNDNGDDAGSD